MDFALLLKAIAPTLISLLINTAGTLKTSTPRAVGTINPHGASAAIKDLQVLLNTVLHLDPPLETDGWLGPKTEEAIQQGIAQLKALGVG